MKVSRVPLSPMQMETLAFASAEPRTPEAIEDNLNSEFGGGERREAWHVTRHINAMLRRGLLERRGRGFIAVNAVLLTREPESPFGKAVADLRAALGSVSLKGGANPETSRLFVVNGSAVLRLAMVGGMLRAELTPAHPLEVLPDA